jgi:hypothetical protein
MLLETKPSAKPGRGSIDNSVQIGAAELDSCFEARIQSILSERVSLSPHDWLFDLPNKKTAAPFQRATRFILRNGSCLPLSCCRHWSCKRIDISNR